MQHGIFKLRRCNSRQFDSLDIAGYYNDFEDLMICVISCFTRTSVVASFYIGSLCSYLARIQVFL